MPFVRKLAAFGSLQDLDRILLEEICANPRRVKAGTVLVLEGDPPGGGVILILNGFACRYKMCPNGLRQIIAHLLPGDLIDLDVMLLPRMDHSIATLSECEVVQIAPACVQRMLRRPALARALRMVALVETAIAREWLVNLGGRPALARVAHLLCELFFRLDAVGMAGSDGFVLPLTQNDLADTTGMSSVHLNRSLKELRNSGLITIEGRYLTILNLPGLRKCGEFRPNYLHLVCQISK